MVRLSSLSGYLNLERWCMVFVCCSRLGGLMCLRRFSSRWLADELGRLLELRIGSHLCLGLCCLLGVKVEAMCCVLLAHGVAAEWQRVFQKTKSFHCEYHRIPVYDWICYWTCYLGLRLHVWFELWLNTLADLWHLVAWHLLNFVFDYTGCRDSRFSGLTGLRKTRVRLHKLQRSLFPGITGLGKTWVWLQVVEILACSDLPVKKNERSQKHRYALLPNQPALMIMAMIFTINLNEKEYSLMVIK